MDDAASKAFIDIVELLQDIRLELKELRRLVYDIKQKK